MLTAVNYLQLLFPDFSLILLGYLVCRFTALDRSVWTAVERLVYYLLFPVLLFHSIVRQPLDLSAASELVLAGWALCLGGIGMAYVLPYLPWIGPRVDRREHAAGAQVAFRFNTFIALALADRLLGAQGTVLIAVLVGVCVPVLNIGAVWPMARHAQRGLLGELVRNPLIIGTVTGLGANLAGFSMPAFLEPTASRIGAAALGLGLMAAGAGLQPGRLRGDKVLSVALLSIRHLWLPLLAWTLARLVGLDPAQTTTLLIFSALPTASSCYVLAVRMGYDGGYTAGLVTVSTLLGLVSLPFALGILRTL